MAGAATTAPQNSRLRNKSEEEVKESQREILIVDLLAEQIKESTWPLPT